MHKKNWALIFCLLLCLFFLIGCKKKQAEPEAEVTPPQGGAQITATPGDQTDANTDTMIISSDKGGEEGSSTTTGALQILDSVAYPMQGMLYGGIAYKNTTGSAIVLTEATFTFTYSGGSKTSTFVPIMASSDIVSPGETSYCTLWLPYDGQGDPPEALSVTADLKYRPADSARHPLAVSSARLIHNYPGFATLSGRLSNPGAEVCNLNMVYVGFYDDNGKLLGVWHFTHNAVIQPDGGVAFVVHLQAFPLPTLTENTKSMQFRAFAI